ncbi:hypothetical protein KCU76_g43, partial [Aureobasidium melanogenum]
MEARPWLSIRRRIFGSVTCRKLSSQLLSVVIACVSIILHFHSQHSVQIVAIEGIQDFSQRNLGIQNPRAPFAMLNFPIFARKTLYMPSLTHPSIVELSPAIPRSIFGKTCIVARCESRADVSHDGVRIVKIWRLHSRIRLQRISTVLLCNELNIFQWVYGLSVPTRLDQR